MIKRHRLIGLGLTFLVLTLVSCAGVPAFDKRRADCQKLNVESERSSCLQKVGEQESAYHRKQNETKIEKDYKRKLEDMR